MTKARALPCDQPSHEPSSCRRRASSTTPVSPAWHALGGNDDFASIVLRPTFPRVFGDPCRRPLALGLVPRVHLRMRSVFLTPAHRECQQQKTGRGCLPGNRGALRLQETPSREPPRGPLRVHRASRPGGCLPAPAHRRFLFPVRTSGSATPPPLHTAGSSWDALFALPRPPRRTTLLRHARRRSDRASWTSTPNGLRSRRRPPPRQVLNPNAPSGQRRAHDRHARQPRG